LSISGQNQRTHLKPGKNQVRDLRTNNNQIKPPPSSISCKQNKRNNRNTQNFHHLNETTHKYNSGDTNKNKKKTHQQQKVHREPNPPQPTAKERNPYEQRQQPASPDPRTSKSPSKERTNAGAKRPNFCAKNNEPNRIRHNLVNGGEMTMGTKEKWRSRRKKGFRRKEGGGSVVWRRDVFAPPYKTGYIREERHGFWGRR